MSKMTIIKKYLYNKRFGIQFAINEFFGIIEPLDDDFYNHFNGMYYQGLPIYYHLCKEMTNGRCYDASTVLALAFKKGCKVCRGDLKSQKYNWANGLGHGWVEKDGYVYDTTWQIKCKTSAYYKIFKPFNLSKTDCEEFIKDMGELGDFTIRSKEWYEENYSLANLLIFQVRELAKRHLENPKLKTSDRIFYSRLLRDLPDETKAKREWNLENFVLPQQAL